MKTNLPKQIIKLKRPMVLLLVALSVVGVSCKKETLEEEVPKNDLNLVGKWTSTTEFPNKLYYTASYEYKADGTGRHLLISASLFETRTLSDQGFKWSTKDNQKLLMEFASGNNIENNYEIKGNTLTYTSDDNRKTIYTKEQAK